ncbi:MULTISPECIES: phosphopyruvate hydratase [Metallosphaera]|uniref:Enolase n=3 Tax=Metallosphaera TaxID=41980 RepID=ENO_METS5|nr:MULTISPECIES: phosphopyruvate hydratase [Metallosphaera]A4YHC1.1 RecName: Full=Enolase; AltName: Full=2-phospho-D-glycerate hydro-lyase; AltName: Full=2-phosphoglycerate dehydratase [Metallosphaera sedula DSM 5348]ABP95823.1 enolase [Metallosphaera sedula DSM 5348]AIM27807.1 enolase [Metallosphaera sedula]AKV74657.1 enolase [Metallosphaera sedula]AKV76894.1 enolase [Metallosphaera sedula]AKV79145.1 enolase [Metallosphaera sedula]
MMNGFSIANVQGYEIIDSRGNLTVRARVTLESGIRATGDAPSGASKGTREAVELRDKDGSVKGAVDSINYYISPALMGLDVREQGKIDRIMIELDGTENKSRLGANATIATSIAVAKTASISMGLEPFMYIGGARTHTLPVPLLNILNGGLHAGNMLKIQEFMVIPVKFDTLKEALIASTKIYKTLKSLVTERYGKIYTALGDEGGISPPLSVTEDALKLVHEAIKRSGMEGRVFMGMDAAASDFYNPEKGVYEIDNTSKSPDEMIEFYVDIASRYPLLYLEDPFEENDFSRYSELQSRIKNVIVTGDDLFTTNVRYLRKGIEMKSARGVIVKANQIGTLTETIQFFDLAKDNSIKTVVSHRSGETEDSFIADLAVGLNSDFIKTGAPSRGERTSKYNRLLEIENEFGLEYLGRRL